MGSTRLPGKVLADLGPKPVLQWVVDAARAIPGNDGVLVATSTAAADDAVAGWCATRRVQVFRGDEDDVLDRFAGAAKEAEADTIIRVTADCPLLDPEQAGKVVAAVVVEKVDYACNNDPPTYPDGLDCEVFTRAALDAAAARARRPSEREHVTPYIRDPANGFRVARISCPLGDLGAERWTLDTSGDLAFLRAVVAELDTAHPPLMSEVLSVLKRSPALRHHNYGIPRNEGLARSLVRDRAAGF
jgi:glutamate-1-semialdehyde 2,1-aminomutase/spore coat polysaccharide biosynthesis protein SpsF